MSEEIVCFLQTEEFPEVREAIAADAGFGIFCEEPHLIPGKRFGRHLRQTEHAVPLSGEPPVDFVACHRFEELPAQGIAAAQQPPVILFDHIAPRILVFLRRDPAFCYLHYTAKQSVCQSADFDSSEMKFARFRQYVQKNKRILALLPKRRKALAIFGKL
jgi:hypothetical protein